MKNIFLLCSVLFILSGFIGCTEEPNSVGNTLIDEKDKFLLFNDSLSTVSDTTFTVALVNGFGSSMLVGKTSDAEAKTLLKFDYSTILDSLRTATFDTAYLRITVNYTWNTPPSQCEIHEVLSPWSYNSVTKDSLPSLQIGTSVAGTISDSLSYSKEIYVKLDTSIVRKWIAAYLDTSKPRFQGFALQIKTGSVSTGFSGIYPMNTSSTVAPLLRIKFTSKSGRRDSLDFYSGQSTFLATGNYTTQPSIEIRGGVGIRSRMRFTFSDNLKRTISDTLNPKPTVNNALLELTQNSTASQLGVGTADTIVATLGIKATSQAPDTSNTQIYVYGKRNGTSTTNPVYVFDVTSIAQRWISGINENEGIVLRTAADNSSVDRMVFFSSKDKNVDASKRPKLYLMYSKK